MSHNQYSFSNASLYRNGATMHHQTVNPYAALVATAGPEHDRRSSSSGTPPSSGSSASLAGYGGVAVYPGTPSRSQAQAFGGSRTTQQHNSYGSPGQVRYPPAGNHSTPTRSSNPGTYRTPGRSSSGSVPHAPTNFQQLQVSQFSSLPGVPESLAVQEMAFREGQRYNSSAPDDVPANPFAKHFDQLWSAFYKLGKECGGQPVSAPVPQSHHNFTWPVLINPHTQSLERPNGSFDPVWSRKMIQIALNCMEELIRVACRRNTGWDKTVADIPLPAQEALMAFPDLAEHYEALKRDAKEALAGGRPYGY